MNRNNFPHSDTLVFFGATGDLAFKKIFPALQAMVKRGNLSVPVIGVAKAGWNLDQLKARAKDSLENHGGLDSEAFGKLCNLLRYVDGDLESNYVRLRISPDIVLAFGLNVTSPMEESRSEPSELLASRHPCAKEMDAYERVLGDAMAGDATLFAREDYVEEAWRIVDPALKAGTPVYEYEPKTWGPVEIERVTPPGGWSNPIVTG
jgi:glucose-6-phosphate 1-dehydrogenase